MKSQVQEFGRLLQEGVSATRAAGKEYAELRKANPGVDVDNELLKLNPEFVAEITWLHRVSVNPNISDAEIIENELRLLELRGKPWPKEDLKLGKLKPV